MVHKIAIVLIAAVLIIAFALFFSLPDIILPEDTVKVSESPQGLAIGDDELFEYFVTSPESNETGDETENETGTYAVTETGNETENETGNDTEPVSGLMGDSVTDCWNDSISPHPICSCDDLNLTRTQASWDYELDNDINFSLCDASYITGLGWNPIGNESEPFTGNFNGANYTITSLFINRPSGNFIGLFGYLDNSSVSNLDLQVNVTGDDRVGGFTGRLNRSTISNSSVTGTVIGNSYIGGLTGETDYNSTISNSSVTGTVTGTVYTGGITGKLDYYSTISNSSVTGSITGSSYTGGFVGYLFTNSVVSNSSITGNTTGYQDTGGIIGIAYGNSIISNSSVTGEVNGNRSTGGIAGSLGDSTILNSYTSGTVTGEEYTGGLTGDVYRSSVLTSYTLGNVTGEEYTGGLSGRMHQSTLSNSYSTKNVTGNDRTGGLIGALYDGSTLSDSYSLGNVNGNQDTGGLAGYVIDWSTILNSYATGSVTGNSATGGLVGRLLSSSTINDSYWLNHTGDNASFCYDSGNENCSAETNAYYFYTITNLPISTWSFPPWDSFCDNAGNPTLIWQNLSNDTQCPGYSPPNFTIEFRAVPSSVLESGVVNWVLNISNHGNLDIEVLINPSWTSSSHKTIAAHSYGTSNWAQGVSCPETGVTRSVNVISDTPNAITKNAEASVSISCPAPTCSKAWSCEEWGVCTGGLQTRECSCACSKESQCTGEHETEQECDACEGVTCEDDGNPCTSVACVDGECVIELFSGNTCGESSDPCIDLVCELGVCTEVLTQNACDDGDVCTEGDKCSGGACVPGDFVCDCKVASDCPAEECFIPSCVEGNCKFTYDETCSKGKTGCDADWKCSKWSKCKGGLKTRMCKCSCDNGDCKGSDQMVDTCDIDATDSELEIVVDGADFVGEDVNVTVYDEYGNIIEGATIQFIAPGGRIVQYEEGFRLYEKGKWAVMADKTGYAGNYVLLQVDNKGASTQDSDSAGVLGSVADAARDFVDWITGSATRSVLLLVTAIIAAVLIVVFAFRRKTGMKTEKI